MATPARLQRLAAAITSDARYEELPAEARGVWCQLYALCSVQAEPGRILTIGPFLDYLARKTALPSSLLGQALEMLADCGFIEMDEDGRGASLPGIVWRGDEAGQREAGAEGQARQGVFKPRRARTPAQVAQSRLNGAKSPGRPRQASFLLPLAGGGVKNPSGAAAEPGNNPSETRENNPSQGSRVSVPGFADSRASREEEEESRNHASNPSSSSSTDARAGAGENPAETQPETQEQVLALAEEVASSVGIHAAEPVTVRGWLANGASIEDIRAGLKLFVALPKGEGAGRRPLIVHHASYITRYVRSATADRREREERERARADRVVAERERPRTLKELQDAWYEGRRRWVHAENLRFDREMAAHRRQEGPEPEPRKPYPVAQPQEASAA